MSDQKMQPLFCQKCGHENPEGSLFCERCGTRLEIPQKAFFPDTDEYEQEPESYDSYTEPASYDSYTEPVREEPVPSEREDDQAESGPAASGPSFDSEKFRESAEKLKESAGKLAGTAGVFAQQAKKKAQESYQKYNESRQNRPEPVAEGLNGINTVNRSIRRYFGMSGMLLAIGFIIVGIVLILTMIGAIFGIIAIVIGVVIFFSSGYAGEKEADEAARREIERLKARGIDKLYGESEDIGLIEPVVVTGFGASPDASLSVKESDVAKRGLFGFMKKPKSSFDPEEWYRVGSDDVIRSMLIQVTVYAFSEDQLFLYIGNVDISTGAIYNEGVSEIYYRDISSINMSQELSKIYNRKKKKFRYYVREYINILGSGISYTTSVRNMLGNSVTEQEFMGMKHLIRDKKKSLT